MFSNKRLFDIEIGNGLYSNRMIYKKLLFIKKLIISEVYFLNFNLDSTLAIIKS